MSDTQQNIEALLSEQRVFEPPAAFAERAIVSDASIYERAERRPRGVLGRAGGPPDLVQALGHGDGLEPAVGDVVRGRHAERLVQLPRPPRRGRRRRQGRVPLGGRARRHPHDHLRGPARRRLPPRERA